MAARHCSPASLDMVLIVGETKWLGKYAWVMRTSVLPLAELFMSRF